VRRHLLGGMRVRWKVQMGNNAITGMTSAFKNDETHEEDEE
jgi:hypothetical protein